MMPIRGHGDDLPCESVPALLAQDRAQLARRATASGAARVVLLTNLAAALRASFRCSRSWADLDEAIALLREALTLAPRGHPHYTIMEDSLATMLCERGRAEDLLEAIGIWRPMRHRLRPGSIDHAETTANLGQALCSYFVHSGRTDDAFDAVALMTESLFSIPSTSKRRAFFESNLAAAMATLHGHVEVGDTGPLEECAARLEQILASPQARRLPGFEATLRANLASLLSARTRRDAGSPPPDYLARPPGVDPADAHVVALVDDTAARHAAMSYFATGRLDALDQAIERGEAALTATDQQGRGPLLANTAYLYVARHVARGRDEYGTADLDTAIEYVHRAIDSRLPALYEPAARGLLGECLLQRFLADQRRHPADLDEAARLLTQATQRAEPAATPTPHLRRRLAEALVCLAKRDGNAAALTSALDILKTDLDRLPLGELPHAIAAGPYAQALLVVAEASRTTSDITMACNAARQAYQELREFSPVHSFEIAIEFGDFAWRLGLMTEAGEAYARAVSTMHELTGVQLMRTEKEVPLRRAAGLSARAAYALVHVGRVNDAAAALETGRALLLSDVMDRESATLAGLDVMHRNRLADRFSAAAERLTRMERAILALPDGEHAEELSAARTEFDRVVREIRVLPGGEGFLRPPTTAELFDLALADGHSIVYIIATERGGIALVVAPQNAGQVIAVRLPSLTTATEEALVHAYQLALDQADEAAFTAVAVELWDVAIGPVTAELPPGVAVTLVPGGRLGLLAPHASRSGVSWALDDRPITYTPNARAIRRRATREIPQRRTRRYLGIAVPHTAGHRDLPEAEREVDNVAGFFMAGETMVGPGDPNEVLRRLASCDVAHFACHAYADPERPLESALLLAGGARLTVRSLLTMPTAPQLVILSACETAVTGGALVDEVVGLPSSLLAAGARGVVATAWPIDDLTARLCVEDFVERWLAGAAPAEALRAAQLELRGLTPHGLVSRLRRTRSPARPSVGALPFSSPFEWASFTYSGTAGDIR
jgi:CHAT domain-containing protein